MNERYCSEYDVIGTWGGCVVVSDFGTGSNVPYPSMRDFFSFLLSRFFRTPTLPLLSIEIDGQGLLLPVLLQLLARRIKWFNASSMVCTYNAISLRAREHALHPPLETLVGEQVTNEANHLQYPHQSSACQPPFGYKPPREQDKW